MAIDDRITAAKKQIEAEEVQSSVVTDVVLSVAAELFPGAGLLRDFLQRHKEENQRLFLETLVAELQALKSRFSELEEKHRTFLQTDFQTLVTDGLKKAEDVRAKDRIARLAKIVATAAERGPATDMDYTEELMRVATELSELDVSILRTLTKQQANVTPFDDGMPKSVEVTLAWDLEAFEGINVPNSLHSACLKLQSYGLLIFISPVQSSATNLRLRKIGKKYPIFAVLKKGFDFIDYLRRQVTSWQ